MLSRVKEPQGLEAQAGALGRRRSPERTGMYTTALVVKGGERTICLYYSGRSQAGENLASLLQERQAGRARPRVMSDALSSHAADEAALSRCHCLAHGRRTCSDLEEVLPHECQVVLEALRQVCAHAEVARNEQREGAARRADHQASSGPILAARKPWRTQQVDDRRGAPNSARGTALASRPGHWETLPRFLSRPGAPIDHTLCERSLTRCIRQRKKALFSKTAYRADVASVSTRLIATGLQAGVHALDSLVALQEPRHAVFLHPAGWLPGHDARGSPSATLRPSVAMTARSGAPCHKSINRARAHKGRCAAAEVGHHVKRP